MKPEIREILEREFDESQLFTKPGTFGNEITYVSGAAIIARLNEAFSADWSFEIQEYKVLDEEIIVLGKLSVDGIVKSQFGSSKITRNRETSAPVSLGDDLKAAGTDSLKKSCYMLGIASYLFEGGNSNKPPKDTPPKKNEPQDHPSENGNGNGNGSGNGRLTNKQLSAIYKIGKDKGLSQGQVKQLSRDTFNKVPDFLTKEEASSMIKSLIDK